MVDGQRVVTGNPVLQMVVKESIAGAFLSPPWTGANTMNTNWKINHFKQHVRWNKTCGSRLPENNITMFVLKRDHSKNLDIINPKWTFHLHNPILSSKHDCHLLFCAQRHWNVQTHPNKRQFSGLAVKTQTCKDLKAAKERIRISLGSYLKEMTWPTFALGTQRCVHWYLLGWYVAHCSIYSNTGNRYIAEDMSVQPWFAKTYQTSWELIPSPNHSTFLSTKKTHGFSHLWRLYNSSALHLRNMGFNFLDPMPEFFCAHTKEQRASGSLGKPANATEIETFSKHWARGKPNATASWIHVNCAFERKWPLTFHILAGYIQFYFHFLHAYSYTYLCIYIYMYTYVMCVCIFKFNNHHYV